jgi:hypothetical protein
MGGRVNYNDRMLLELAKEMAKTMDAMGATEMKIRTGRISVDIEIMQMVDDETH